MVVSCLLSSTKRTSTMCMLTCACGQSMLCSIGCSVVLRRSRAIRHGVRTKADFSFRSVTLLLFHIVPIWKRLAISRCASAKLSSRAGFTVFLCRLFDLMIFLAACRLLGLLYEQLGFPVLPRFSAPADSSSFCGCWHLEEQVRSHCNRALCEKRTEECGTLEVWTAIVNSFW